MMLWIELGVVAIITTLFVASAFFWLRPEDVDHDPARVRIGAAMQGLIVGLLVGFVILPLRLAFLIPGAEGGTPAHPPSPSPSGGMASLSILPFLIMLIIVRRGLLARAPVIGVYLRAYRKAMLKRQIAGAQAALARLTRIDADDKT